ncbi:c-type cytochrome domain-containing protein [Humisphaera borealis]
MPPAGKSLEFFENKIRPVLVEHCYQCHSAQSEKLKAGLHLDSRDGLMKGATRARHWTWPTRTKACSSERCGTMTRSTCGCRRSSGCRTWSRRTS